MIIGHQKQWQFLKNSFQKGRLSHAYLFAGPEKLGKKKIAFEFAKLIFGREDLRLPHPDFIYLQPEKKTIQIQEIRELIWKTSLKPVLSPLKIAILDDAHLMTRDSQNCLLKTLEEPKGETILIFITALPHLLLSTILSRCEIIKFYPVKKEEIEDFLKNQGIGEERRREILQFSWGRPGVAIDLISQPQALENKKRIIREFIQILNSDLPSRFQYLQELVEKSPDLNQILGVWLNFLNLELLAKFNFNFKGSTDFSLKKLKEILGELQNLIFLTSITNVNQKLALEVFMLKLYGETQT